MRPGNRLLATLADEDFDRLRPHLRTVALPAKHILHRQGERLRAVYFPNGGVVSLATALADGGMVEAASIGDEGVVGIEALFGPEARSSCETIVQATAGADTAEMIGADRLREAIAERPAIGRAVGAYGQALFVMLARLSACNAVHDVQRRCARWLLMTDDRLHGHDFRISHEFLAVMLGVRRPTVSEVAERLQQAGVVHYTRGSVAILDRAKLACECYATIRESVERHLPYSPGW